MPIENVFNSIVNIDLWFVVKMMVLLGMVLYLIFAGVVIRQVQLMSGSLNGTLDLPLRTIAWVHFGVAVAVFLFAVVVL